MFLGYLSYYREQQMDIQKERVSKRILPWSWLRLVFAACLLTRLVRPFRWSWATTLRFLRFLFLANFRGRGSTCVRVWVLFASFGGAFLACFAILPGVYKWVALSSFLWLAVFFCDLIPIFLFTSSFLLPFIRLLFPILFFVLLFLIFLRTTTSFPPPLTLLTGSLLLVFAAATMAAFPRLSAPFPLLFLLLLPLPAATTTVSSPHPASISIPVSRSGPGPTSVTPPFPGIAAVLLVPTWSLSAPPPSDALSAIAVTPVGATAATALASLVRQRATSAPLTPWRGGSRWAAGGCWRGGRGGWRLTAAVAGGRRRAAAATISRGITTIFSWSLSPSPGVLNFTTLLFTTRSTPFYYRLRLPLFYFLFMWRLCLALIILPPFSAQPLLCHVFWGNKQKC